MTIRQFLTVREVADIFKLNILTIYDYIRTGKLQAIKFGRAYRIDSSSLEQFIQAHLTSPPINDSLQKE
ncbi:helix-turn-helix domain-containing protein [Candidatus Gottesmanbacteria bacterium]|nr:helix-turn-helix domain-containing protein [Candidatus Gottesmanbacteria bacterium]